MSSAPNKRKRVTTAEADNQRCQLYELAEKLTKKTADDNELRIAALWLQRVADFGCGVLLPPADPRRAKTHNRNLRAAIVDKVLRKHGTPEEVREEFLFSLTRVSEERRRQDLAKWNEEAEQQIRALPNIEKHIAVLVPKDLQAQLRSLLEGK